MSNVRHHLERKRRQYTLALIQRAKKLITLRGDPRHIALGFALGVFVGFTPTMGIQMAIAGALAALLKWNACSAMAGVWITTPATAPFVYGITYVVGAKVFYWLTGTPLPLRFRFHEITDILSKTPRMFLALIMGGILLGIPASIITYYLTLFLIQEYRRDKTKVIAYLTTSRLGRLLHVTHEREDSMAQPAPDNARAFPNNAARTSAVEHVIVLIGGGAIVVLSLAVAVVMFWHARQIDAEIRKISQTLESVGHLENASKNALLHHRNFMLAGIDQDAAFYEQYRDIAVNECARLLQVMEMEQSYGHIYAFKQSIDAKFSMLDEMIAVRRHEGLGASIERMFREIVKPAADDVQQLLDELEGHKDDLLRELLARSEGKSYTMIVIVLIGSGSSFLILLAMFAVLLREIQGRIGLEEALKLAKETAEEANRAKSRFLATMSHELRTPLNGILGYAQLLQREATLTEAHQRAIATIHRSGEHLLGLITDVLDVAKIEAGKIDIEPHWYSLRESLCTIIDVVAIRARHQRLEFVYALAADLPQRVYGDEKRINQILLNMLGNAIKFTPQGRVELRVTLEKVTPMRLRFEVSDTGIGIAPEHLAQLFRPFQRVHNPQLRIEGTGLGLSISQHLLRLMGSEMAIESAPGQGSRFWFDLTFPAAAEDAPDDDAPAKCVVGYAGRAQNLLIVDDHEDSRVVLTNMLAPLGFEVATARNAQEALDMARRVMPDAILMDVMMPVMNGGDAARRLRDFPQLARTAIIAISADLSQYDAFKANACPYDDFLSKPVRFEALLQALQRHLGIDWLYETAPQPERASEHDASPIIPPSQAILRALREAALIGDIREIQREAAALQTHSEFAAFAKAILTRAAAFRVLDIQTFVESYMEVPNDEHDQ